MANIANMAKIHGHLKNGQQLPRPSWAVRRENFAGSIYLPRFPSCLLSTGYFLCGAGSGIGA
jgi:hypothetical protein